MVSERRVTILNEKGLHVRPAAAFAQAAAQFRSRISVHKHNHAVNGKSSIELLTLAAVPGTELVIRADGEDAETAAESLARLVHERFGMRDD